MKNIINLLSNPLQTIKRIVFFASTILFVLHGCQKDLELNNVPIITDEVEVGTSFAVISGKIDCPVSTRKLEVYIYTKQTYDNPTLYTPTIVDGNTFEIDITDLDINTTYHYRYVIYSTVDKAELKQRTFTTKELSAPCVITGDITNVGMTSAMCGGEIKDDGGCTITACGVCWSTMEMATTADSHTSEEGGVGTFVSNIADLAGATTYYIRAYATNEKGTAYGDQKTFTTTDGLPRVVTAEVSDITKVSAVCGGTVIADYGFDVTACGICWSTGQNPSIETANHTADGTGLGEFVSNITNLTDSTTYYVRAYATNQNGTAYGEERVFTTLGDYINGHKYVDLGLPSGTKWATCNVGATQEWEFGDYYAWGETETKEEYYIENCRTYHMELTNISGNPTFDAATVHWGSTWRIPTKEEMEELIINCSRTWITSYNGVNGYRMTGPNGNSIFLPAAGRHYNERHIGESNGYYWSATSGGLYWAEHINFYPDNEFPIYSSYRNYGQPIRPVSN